MIKTLKLTTLQRWPTLRDWVALPWLIAEGGNCELVLAPQQRCVAAESVRETGDTHTQEEC